MVGTGMFLRKKKKKFPCQVLQCFCVLKRNSHFFTCIRTQNSNSGALVPPSHPNTGTFEKMYNVTWRGKGKGWMTIGDDITLPDKWTLRKT
jgi:hypothetical protein